MSDDMELYELVKNIVSSSKTKSIRYIITINGKTLGVLDLMDFCYEEFHNRKKVDKLLEYMINNSSLFALNSERIDKFNLVTKHFTLNQLDSTTLELIYPEGNKRTIKLIHDTLDCIRILYDGVIIGYDMKENINLEDNFFFVVYRKSNGLVRLVSRYGGHFLLASRGSMDTLVFRNISEATELGLANSIIYCINQGYIDKDEVLRYYNRLMANVVNYSRLLPDLSRLNREYPDIITNDMLGEITRLTFLEGDDI